jgi:alpha,alpha-trehalase
MTNKSTHDHSYQTFTPHELKPALEYIEKYWRSVKRFQPNDTGTAIGLPQPYIVPTAEFTHGFTYDEMYYWDSYFTALGLYGTSQQKIAFGMLQNFRNLMKRYAFIPNASRTYMLSRSQPPFLTSYIFDVYEAKLVKDKRWLKSMMKIAQKEYTHVWMSAKHPHSRQVFEGLSRYYDINYLHDLAEAESGWDMTSRFERKCLNYIPIDLNAQLFRYEMDFARAAEIRGKHREMSQWLEQSETRLNTINKHLWDTKKGFYFDYNFETNKRSPIYSLAAYVPLWAGMASKEQAAAVVEKLHLFEYDGGLSATAKDPDPKSEIPIQWAYPNGWAPLHVLVVCGLENYGYTLEAQRIARKWIRTCLDRFESDGVFLEKYNVVHPQQEPSQGVYPNQTGFSWTNAVFYRLCLDFLQPDELPVLKYDKKPQDVAGDIATTADQYVRRFTARVRRPFEF